MPPSIDLDFLLQESVSTSQSRVLFVLFAIVISSHRNHPRSAPEGQWRFVYTIGKMDHY
jgi:hypothetical protein